MTRPAYSVVGYGFDRLVALLAEQSDQKFVLSKTHSVYFEGYFKELDAQTIVVEDSYVDHDYLEDFTAYYVRCFNPYSRYTRRLHFFSTAFDEQQFASILGGENNELLGALEKSYLGFVVVKPLPKTLVGRTCLKTYPPDNGRRHFPILQEYTASLFGIRLPVVTIAFQEQDSVVAACATSALWSVFQGTGQIFHHRIPSPAEITRIAVDHIPEELAQSLPETRGMPNNGLTASQMARATRGVGLEPYLAGTGTSSVLRGTAYAYLRARIPMILVISLTETTNGNFEDIGRHGVAVTGYSLGIKERKTIADSKVNLRACRIDKIYVHDDQVGPFARMAFLDDGSLDTSWFVRQNRTVIALPEFVLIPLYHKIRIPYECIEKAVLELGTILDVMTTALLPAEKRPEVEWDVYLTTVNDLKSEVLSCTALDPAVKREFVASALPKYLWRATVFMNEQPEADFLFDATDIEQRGAFLCTLEYGPNVAMLLRAFSAKRPATVSFGTTAESVLTSFTAHP